MIKECRHRGRLIYAIYAHLEKEPHLFYEALENFRKYGDEIPSEWQVNNRNLLPNEYGNISPQLNIEKFLPLKLATINGRPIA